MPKSSCLDDEPAGCQIKIRAWHVNETRPPERPKMPMFAASISIVYHAFIESEIDTCSRTGIVGALLTGAVYLFVFLD